ncbi:hypothetical protein Tco_0458694, partial [Tanacetum coccineum]
MLEELVTLLWQFADCDHARVPQIEVFYPSKFRENVSRRQKKVKFEWGDKQEAAFQLLKQKLCSALISMDMS